MIRGAQTSARLPKEICLSEGFFGSSQTWLFAIFILRPFTLFGALSRTCVCVFLRSFALLCSFPCPSFPCFFFEFLAFPLPGIPCFLSVFPFFSKHFRCSVRMKNPCFLGGFPCHFQKKRGKEDQSCAFWHSFMCVFLCPTVRVSSRALRGSGGVHRIFRG